MSPGLIFVQKGFSAGLIFGGGGGGVEAYFRRGLLMAGIVRFKVGWT